MKTVCDPGMLTIKTDRFGLQLYYPVLTVAAKALKLSLSTAFVISCNTWQFDWSVGFQILGFGFGVGKYKERN